MRAMVGLLVGLAMGVWAHAGWAQAGHGPVVADPAWTQPEAWAWGQLAAGKVADFEVLCRSAGPECRTLRGATIAQILSQAPWSDALPHYGLQIVGALVQDDVDLVNAHVVAAISLVRTQVNGNLLLTRAKLDHLLALDGTDITGEVQAIGLQAEADVSLTDGRWLMLDSKRKSFHAHGPVNLQNAQIKGSVFLNASAFDDDFTLSGAHVAGDVKTSGATFQKQLLGAAVQVAGNLWINATIVTDAVKFPAASVGGTVDIDSSQFLRLNMIGAKVTGDLILVNLRTGGDVNLSGLTLGGGLSLPDPDAAAQDLPEGTDPCGKEAGRAPVFRGDLLLTGAAIAGVTELSGLAMTGTLDIANARVGNALNLREACLQKDLDLASLQVTGDLRLGGAHVMGETIAANLDVVHDLDMSRATFDKPVNLFGAQIGDTVHVEHAAFRDTLIAPWFHARSDLKLQESTFGGLVDLSRTRLGGDLDLTGAHFMTLDLNRADISGALIVDAVTNWDAKAGQLNLTHAHLGALQDAGGVAEEGCPDGGGPRDHNGWPATGLHLDGLTYDHLGEAAGQEGVNMRARNVCWWRWWLRQDEPFSEQPYMQLAAVMAAHGDKGDASAITYFGRQRETSLAWAGGHYGRGLLLALFDVTVGYGIGDYSWRALLWSAVLIVAGFLLLGRTEGAKTHSWPWRFGASMTRVLPVIEINKEFSDFFNDPDRKRLTGRQTAVFSVLAVCGWVLGLFILAAMSGLTQHF